MDCYKLVWSLSTIVALKRTSLALFETATVAPLMKGSAYITQYSEVVVDPEQPFSNGYKVSNIYGEKIIYV